MTCYTGNIDAQQWRTMQENLFLEPEHILSRVECYPVDMIKSRGDFAYSIDHPTPTTMTAEPSEDDDQFEEIQYATLRSAEDIEDYVNKTPNFRAFFIRQKYSWGPLLISSRLFRSLVLQAQISSQIRDFISYLGTREREVEIMPPALRFVSHVSQSETLPMDHACVYGLRYMERNGRNDLSRPSRQWSLRQSVIYCRYAPSKDGISWLFITISNRMRQNLELLATRDTCSNSDPFEVHLLLVECAVSSWRHYLLDLAAEIDLQYRQILGTSPGGDGPVNLHDSDRRQQLLVLDETLLNALLATCATTDTLSALLSEWESLSRPFQIPARDAEVFRRAFENQKRSLHLTTTQIEGLRSKIAGITRLLSSFLDLSSGFSLQNLVKESGKENEEMRKLSERMHVLAEDSNRDAAAVKVLTIITLIYLPLTVVSNFFSTSFVNMSGSGSITVSSDWWILFAAAVPLTLLTVYIWIVWSGIKTSQNGLSWWKIMIGLHLLNRHPRSGTPTQRSSDLQVENKPLGNSGLAANAKGYSAQVLEQRSMEPC